MYVGLHDADAEHIKKKMFPNYALMKISAYHKRRGDRVEWWQPMCNQFYDVVYSSKVFDFTPENPYLPDNTIKGGTGYDISSKLPDEIESIYPDYSIYPQCDYAIGYITRGCPNNCRWCVVPRKEGGIKPYRTWEQLIRSDSDKLVLMDNNILACEYGVQQLESISRSTIKIDLNQGMDARLVTPSIAHILSKIKWIRHIRFSCDTTPQIAAVTQAARYLADNGIKPYKLFVYLLVTADIENAERRVRELTKIGDITIYAQAERNPTQGVSPNAIQLEFAQRYIYGRKYKTETWKNYCEKRGIKNDT